MTTTDTPSFKPKGNNFKPQEDHALAACWISTSSKTDEHNTETFWNTLATSYAQQPTVSAPRSPASLKCRWTIVQRIAQKYLSADKLYRANIPSGETEEDTSANIMLLYREKNSAVRNGKKKLAAPVKFLSAIKLLSAHPKFAQRIGGLHQISNTLQISGNTPPQSSRFQSMGESSTSQIATGNVPMIQPFRKRPIGIKQQKKDLEKKKDIQIMSKAINKVGDAIQGSTRAKLRASSVALQLKVLRELKSVDENYEKKMKVLLMRAAALAHLSDEPQPVLGTALPDVLERGNEAVTTMAAKNADDDMELFDHTNDARECGQEDIDK